MATGKRAKRARTAPRQRLTLRVALRDVAPPVWREISLPDAYTLEQLHRCIQLVFDWFDHHLYEFRVGERCFERADPEAKGEDAGRTSLADLALEPGATFLYLYDMGDGWKHHVSVRACEAFPADEEPDFLAYLVAGARAAPPEDVGGPEGYERLVAAYRRRQGLGDHHEELLAWAGPGFDPDLFDRRATNHALVLATAWGVI